MSRLRAHVFASTGALLLLGTLQVVLESVVAAAVYRGQVLPPYGFFPNQLYDFLAKLRWVAGDSLAWLPSLPDSFRPPSPFEHIAILFDLLPACVAMALLAGPLGGLLGGLAVRRNRSANLRAYLLAWAVFGVLIHLALAIPPLSLQEDPGLRQLIYRLRSVVIDGGAVSLGVLVSALAASWLAAPLLERAKTRSWGLTALLLAAAALSAMVTAESETALEVAATAVVASPDRNRTNVVLVSLDSLRADHVGCYGYERDTTPAIDRLAGEGVRFANAIATSSWTLPTHLTMFTSRYQLSHGVVHETITLSPSIPTLGEVLKANGYATAGFVSAPYVAAHYGYDRGMDQYVDISASYGHRNEARSAIVSPRLNDLTLPWLEQHKDEPFFLFFHNFDIHYDYIPPPPYDTMFDADYQGSIDGTDFIERPDVNRRMNGRDLEHVLALYDGEIRFADDHLGAILDKIDELGLRDRTLVIVVSDHGDEFFEHGNKGHHRSLYEEVLRIPLVIRLPQGASAGTTVNEQVSLVDLMPTILDVLEIDPPPGLEGLSLMPLIERRTWGRNAIYAEFFDKRGFNLQVARRTSKTKVIQHFNRITHPKRGAIEFYDLAQDPSEKRDIAATHTRQIRTELEKMAPWLNERWRVIRNVERRDAGTNRIQIDEDTLERLKSLGYVGD